MGLCFCERKCLILVKMVHKVIFFVKNAQFVSKLIIITNHAIRYNFV